MAKTKYALPYSINVTFFDSPISLKKGDLGPKRPWTIASIAIFVIAGLSWAYFIYKIFGAHVGFANIIFGSIAYWSIVALSLRRQDDGRLGYTWFLPTLAYWISGNARKINTNYDAGDNELAKLKYEIPVERIHEDTGVINYTNGSVGVLIDVIGLGSKTLFVEERDHIIGTFERYLSEIHEGTRLGLKSQETSQNVEEQLAYLESVSEVGQDPLVDQLVDHRKNILENAIGRNFKTTKQLLFLTARNAQILSDEISLLRQQADQGLLRDMNILKGDDLVKELHNFYSIL